MEIRFRLNPKNEKDKVIIEYLKGEYSATDTIKSVLYKLATNNSNIQPITLQSTNGQYTEDKKECVTPINSDKKDNDSTITDTTGFEDFFN